MSYAQAVTYIDQLPPMVQLSSAYGAKSNPYYEEVVKDHPNIQSKIRQTDTNYFGKYEETLAVPPPPPSIPVYPNEGRAVPIPDYPLKGSPPATLQQNYVPGSMNTDASEQHLPVAQNLPTHYLRPLAGSAYQSTYPIVEHMTCTQCNFWQNKCERLYLFIIGALVVIVLLLLRKVAWSK
jgi:hypothetical protein